MKKYAIFQLFCYDYGESEIRFMNYGFSKDHHFGLLVPIRRCQILYGLYLWPKKVKTDSIFLALTHHDLNQFDGPCG